MVFRRSRILFFLVSRDGGDISEGHIRPHRAKYINQTGKVTIMGGSHTGSRRAELGNDLDSYISNVRKRKPFSVAQKKRTWSIWPFSSGRDDMLASIKPSPVYQAPRSRPTEEVARTSFWDGIKTSMRDTVRKDLETINQQQGANNMRQDDDFIDFEDGGLKVVPIPDDEPIQRPKPSAGPSMAYGAVTKTKPSPEQVHVMLDPFAEDPVVEKPASKPGFFSRLFSKKKAAKEEAKMDEDFLMQATPVVSAAPSVDLELKDDFKELSKIFLKSLERMNKDQLNSFKSTDDFERFKTLLKKHSVIK